MNRAIRRVYVVLASGLVLLLAFTAYWQLWAEPSLAARRDNAHQVVQQLSIRRGLILAADGTKLAINHGATTADGRKVFQRRYPDAEDVRAHRGLLVRHRRARRGRALGQRLPRGRPHRSRRHDREPAALAGGRHRDRRRRPALAHPGGAAQGDERPGGDRQGGRRRGHRAPHGPRARECVVAELQSEQGGAGLPAGHRQRARQSRHAGPLPAGLGHQAGDRRTGARERPLPARQPVQRSGLFRGVRQEDLQRLGRGLRAHRPDRRAHALGQQRVREPRRLALRRSRALSHAHARPAAPGLLLDSAARLPDQPDGGLRHGAARARTRCSRRTRRSTRPAPPSARPISSRRRCRWRASPRPSRTGAS